MGSLLEVCLKTLSLGEEMSFKNTTEALICSAQEQGIRTSFNKYHIDKSVYSPSCRMCGETGKTISHIANECSKTGRREYIRKLDSAARMVHWKLYEEFTPEKSEK